MAGQPAAIEVVPGSLSLTGLHDARQLLITGKYTDGTVRDLTAVASAVAEPAGVVDVQDGLYLRPKKNGAATLVVSVGGKQARVSVTVSGMDKPAPVSFRRDVIATLNVGGCNAGACHGTPSGKNGFKLSLRGFDPPPTTCNSPAISSAVARAKQDADQSLVFLKAVGRVPHEGGQRFGANSLPGEMMSAWLTDGLKDDPPTLPGDQESRSRCPVRGF